MDSSQDVLWDWSYKHPGPPTPVHPAYNQDNKPIFDESDTRRKQADFLKVLKDKSLRLFTNRLIFSYYVGLELLIALGLQGKEIDDAWVITLGYAAILHVENNNNLQDYLDNLPL